jgi:hypothetical protein
LPGCPTATVFRRAPLSTATSKPEPAAPPEPTAQPSRPAGCEEESPAREPEGGLADRTALVFWLIAFAILAFVTICDLVMIQFR